MKLINIGFGSMIAANRLLAVVAPDSAPIKRVVQEAKDRAMIAAKHGFCDIQYALFHRERVFSAKEYVKLLGTYSDHIAIEESIRKKFFEKIEEAINKHGGSITIYDTMDLQLARKGESKC